MSSNAVHILGQAYRIRHPRDTIFPMALGIFSEWWGKKYVLYQLVRRDLADRHMGSFFGLFWIFFQQISMLGILWFVLHFGLRVRPAGNVPFLAWMLPPLVLWTFFFEAANTSSHAIVHYSDLVKKVPLELSMLPVVKVLSAAVIHFIFLAVAVPVLFFLGIRPSFFWFQSLYYFFACVCLVLGIGWLTSAVMVFFRDISAGLGIFLNLLMWLTPIYWNMELLEPRFKIFCYLNPVSYLTEGYRRSFLYQIPFWKEPLWTLYFWGITAIFLAAGIFMFKKLKLHFADVL